MGHLAQEPSLSELSPTLSPPFTWVCLFSTKKKEEKREGEKERGKEGEMKEGREGGRGERRKGKI